MTLRVIEYGGAAAGYCGRLFAHLGADVLRLEAHADPAGQAPSEAARAHLTALDAYLHAGKRRRVLAAGDPGAAFAAATQAFLAGVANAGDASAQADVLVLEGTPDELDALGWREIPARVRVAITPFGLDGPYRAWRATPNVLLAMGGYTMLMGDPGRAPLTLPGHYVEYQSGQYAYIGALAAWLAERAPEETAAERPSDADGAQRPCTVEVSMWEAVLSLSQFTTLMWTYTGRLRGRNGNHWENLAPLSLFRCADGWYLVNIVPGFWVPFTRMLGRPELADDPRFATNDARMANRDALHAIVDAELGARTMAELLELGQRVARVPTGTAMDLQQILDDPHLAERGAWDAVQAEGGPLLRVPAVPYRYTARRTLTDAERAQAPHGAPLPAAEGPLRGVRVLDFTHVWAGPLGTRILADLGAEVTKIEAPFVRGPANVAATRNGIYPGGELGPDPWNRQGITNKLNRNKLGVCVDVKQPEGRALVRDLVRHSDVVIDNFSARAMRGMGLDIDSLHALNPAVVHVTMPGYGLSGPYKDFVAYGPSVEPMAGFTSLMGYGDAEPRVSAVALPDAIAGVTAAAAVLTALYRRAVHGESGLVECTLHEGAVAMLGDAFALRQLTGEQPARIGNAHVAYAPHGVYRCAPDATLGDDAWIAIAVCDDAAWQALRAALDLPDHAHWRHAAGRLADTAALDAVLEARTLRHDRLALARTLQAAGVAAGALMVTPDWLADPHLHARGFFAELGAPHIAPIAYPGTPLRVDGERGAGWFAAPRLGEHNERVASQRLGWPADRIAAAQAAGALVKRPPDGPPM